MYAASRIDSVREFEQLETVWDQLLDQSEHPNIFQTFDWLHTWWQVFGEEHQLYLLTFRESDKIVGLAPLMISGSRMGIRRRRTVRFIGTPEMDYGNFIGPDPEGIASSVVEYLTNHSSDWTDIDLTQISERTSTADHLASSLRKERLPFRVLPIETCSAYIFEGTESERAEFNPRKNKGLKSSMNFFNRTEELVLEDVRDKSETKQLLPVLFQYHANRWNETPSPSFFLEPRYRAFYLALADRLTQKGYTSMLALKQGQLPLAYQFNFIYRHTVYMYTLTHNVFHHKRAPGAIINYMAQRHYVRENFAELDFLRGAQSHKTGLTNQTKYNYQVRVYRGRLRRAAAERYDRMKTTGIIQKAKKNRRLMNVHAKTASFLRREGVSNLLRKLVSKAFSWLWSSETVIMFSSTGSHDSSPQPTIDIEIRKLTEKDLPEIATFLGVVAESERFRILGERFEENADCFASLHNGQIVCIGWGLHHEDHNPLTGFSALPRRKQVLLSDGYTSPLFRGMRLRPHLMAHQLDHYQREGLQCITAIDKSNTASIKVVERLRFKKAKSVRQLSILGLNVLRPRAVTVE